MKQKRRSPVVVKIIALLLLLASLGCLLLPWMKLSVDVKEERMTPGQVLENYLGLDRDSVLDMLETELARAVLPTERETLSRLISGVWEGQYSLPDLAFLCGDLSELGRSFGQNDAAGTLDTARLAVWGVIGLLGLLWLVAVCCQLSDRRGGILPYLLVLMLVTGALLFLRSKANTALEEGGYELLNQANMGFLPGMFGIDLAIVKMGYAAYLSPVLALLALLFMGIRKKAPGKEVSPYPARRSAATRPAPAEESGDVPIRKGWTCPNCGHIGHPDSQVCELCGTRRALRPVFCPECGTRLPRGASFCTECGTSLAADLPEEGK